VLPSSDPEGRVEALAALAHPRASIDLSVDPNGAHRAAATFIHDRNTRLAAFLEVDRWAV
jgi:hypothetical protein